MRFLGHSSELGLVRLEADVIETQVKSDVNSVVALSRVANFDVYVNVEECPADLGKGHDRDCNE